MAGTAEGLRRHCARPSHRPAGNLLHPAVPGHDGLPRTIKTDTASWFTDTLPAATIASKVGLLLKCVRFETIRYASGGTASSRSPAPWQGTWVWPGDRVSVLGFTGVDYDNGDGAGPGCCCCHEGVSSQILTTGFSWITEIIHENYPEPTGTQHNSASVRALETAHGSRLHPHPRPKRRDNIHSSSRATRASSETRTAPGRR